MSTILVIDDTSFDRMAISAAVEKLGHTPLCAEGGEEAILTLKKSHGSIDLVLLDLIMPRVDGISVLGHCRSNYPDLPVIVVSGNTDQGDIDEAKKWGIEHYIKKPYTLDLLERAIGDSLRKKLRAG